MVAQPLPDPAAEIRAAYDEALTEYDVAWRQYQETSGGCMDDPRTVLRHDAACARLEAAENKLRAVLHDARALGIPLVPPAPQPDPQLWWETTAGAVGVCVVALLVAWASLARGWHLVFPLGLMCVLAVVVLAVGELTEGRGRRG